MASRLAIQRHRAFVEDEGLVPRDIFQENFIQLLRFLFHDTDRHKDPRFFQLADPLPATRGFGSSIATTTRSTPFSTTRSAHGGVFP